MIQQTIGATEPTAVQVATPQVWLRRNIRQETLETAQGEDVRSYDAWICDEVTFIDPAITEDYATERFDELWAAHGHDGMTDAERIAALQARIDEQDAALMELGDMLGGE